MNGTMEQEDCFVEMVGTPTRKKLKQARLPFQTVNSSESSNTASSKKRKLSSPSPTNSKSEKIAKKENALKKNDDNAVVYKNETDEAQQVVDESPETSTKGDGKLLVKPNVLTRFLQKGAVSSVNVKTKNNLDVNEPVVILSRCDDGTNKQEKNLTISDNLSDSINSNENKIDGSEMLDSRYEKSTNSSSLDSVEEGDVVPGKSTTMCGDNVAANSDSESEPSSSEEDNNNDDDDEDDGDDDDDDDDVGGDGTGGGPDDDDEHVNDDNDDKKLISDGTLERTPLLNPNEQKFDVRRKKLTPRQLEKKIEMKKKQEARQNLKAEREKQRVQKKLARRQEREAKKEQKRKEKEKKELEKQMEIEQKQKEKERKERAKEEDRRKREEAKEEEKRRKEEEKLEVERKKQKAASTFVSFFVPKKQETKPAVEERVIGACNFMPFEIKPDMKMAPTCRRSLSNAEKLELDSVCHNNIVSPPALYLDEIRSDNSIIRRAGKTWSAGAKNDVVVLEEDDMDGANIVEQTTAVMEKHRPKLLFFAENRRPPYWGTWRKKSNVVNSRRPFTKDAKWFDYEIDSDEEWEEEEPGESLRGSDDEKDEENPDDDEYDVDNEFMVPHGYLSDEEARADGEDEENMSPETQKFKLKILGEQFEAEMNEKTAKIKPKIIGCIWQGRLNSYPENTSLHVEKFLTERHAWVSETPITLDSSVEGAGVLSNADPPSTSKKQSTPGIKKTKVPEEALPDLIRLIHGNPHGRPFLIKEFITYWHRKYPENKQQLSKISVAQKIQDLAKRMACPEEGPMHMKTCWYVSEEVRKKYLDEDLTLPNNWLYVLTPKRKMLNEPTELLEKIEKEKELHDRDKDKEQKEKDKEKKSVPLITQFTKKITQEEMKKQLSPNPSSKLLSEMKSNKPQKRVTLISVARGEPFPKASIVNAFSKVSQSSECNVECPPGTSDTPIIINDDSSHSPQKKGESTTMYHMKDHDKA